MKTPTLAQCEKALGEEASTWEARCFEIASRIVKAGLVKGTAVYGHWTGKIHKESRFARRAALGFVQHGWVLLEDGRVLDPTRWVFENKKPYLYVGPLTSEYDEGGNVLRSVLREPPPEYDPDEKRFEFTKSRLATKPWNHVEKLLQIDLGEQAPGTVTTSQLFWLANLPYDTLQPHAAAIYDAITLVGEEVAIPLDNRRRAQREAS